MKIEVANQKRYFKLTIVLGSILFFVWIAVLITLPFTSININKKIIELSKKNEINQIIMLRKLKKWDLIEYVIRDMKLLYFFGLLWLMLIVVFLYFGQGKKKKRDKKSNKSSNKSHIKYNKKEDQYILEIMLKEVRHKFEHVKNARSTDNDTLLRNNLIGARKSIREFLNKFPNYRDEQVNEKVCLSFENEIKTLVHKEIDSIVEYTKDVIDSDKSNYTKKRRLNRAIKDLNTLYYYGGEIPTIIDDYIRLYNKKLSKLES